MNARAFAMPMVLVLVVVVGMMSAVMLDRQATQRLVVQRQLNWYQEHHARLGLQEAIEAWIRSLPSGTEIGALLPGDGHFLDLELRGGDRATIYFNDRQNAVLTDLAAVDDASLDAAAAIVSAVAVVFGQDGPPDDGLRTVGPPQLSVHSISPQLLEVAAQAITGDTSSARAFAAALIADRNSNGGRASASAIGLAIADATSDPEIRSRLSRMFTVRPTLYYATVELRDSSIGPPVARYGGYFVVSTSRTTSGAERSAFLTWENIGVE